MEQFPDGYVDVKRPEDGENGHGFRGRQYSQEYQATSPTKPQASSSLTNTPNASNHSHYFPQAQAQAQGQGQQRQNSDPIPESQFSQSQPQAQPQAQSQPQTHAHRPSLSNERRHSSGLGGGMGSLGSIRGAAPEDVVPVGFDEADRIKQSIASCKQVSVFFRSRAEIEEKYARSIVELVRTTGDTYSRADCKAGSFVNAYQGSLKLQDQIAQNRLRFSQRLNEMSEELLGLAREGEKMRKIHKDNGARYQGILQESEMVMDKAKGRFDATAEELERLLVAKEGESFKDAGMRSSASSSSTSTSGNPSGGGKRALGKAMTKGGLLFKGKGVGSMQRQEDDVRTRMAQASETFRKAVLESQALRQEYFNFQLPKILRLLKECADELDLGTQYHLTRFAFLYESTIVSDGTLLNPMSAADEGPGLKTIFESIDNRSDFKSYMQNYAVARGTPRGPRREGPYEEGFVSRTCHMTRALADSGVQLPPLPPHVQRNADAMAAASTGPQSSHTSQVSQISIPSTATAPYSTTSTAQTNGVGQQQQSEQVSIPETYAVPGIPSAGGATFGVDLGEQLARDGVEVPRVVEKCAQAIDAYGLDSMGIYRLSGMTSRVQALKHALDKDVDNTDVMSDEWSSDINVVSGALKLWFRELPEPLLTYGLYHSFIEAARYENDRLRHIRLHEQVNELPDPNYATLKFFMAHLDRVRRKDSVNQMSVSNLSIVFGPTLLGAPPEEGGLNLEHMSFQCKAIETILEKYHEIFVEEDGESAGSAQG